MTDDAPSNGRPDPKAEPPAPPQPPSGAVVDNPDLPPPAAPEDPRGPVDPEPPTRTTRAGTTGAVVAVGTGLLGAAVAISAIKSRDSDDGSLDWSNYGAGLAATAVLLLAALLAALVARRQVGDRAREEAVTWPGVVGILATALMVDVGLDSDERWLGYAVGAGIVVLAALGYLASRRAAFVVTAIVGLGLLYALAFEDLVADQVDDDHAIAVMAAATAVFVIVVTVLGWLLPSRAVSGVAVGALGVASYVGNLAFLLLGQYLGGIFGGAGTGEPESAFGLAVADDSDIWAVLACAGVLTLLWALAAAISDHSGFAILAIVMPTAVTPLGLLLLAERHPSYWSGALAVAGGLLLLGGVLLTRLRGRSKVEGLPQTY